MSLSVIMFYVLAAWILGCGILAVSTRKIFRSAIYLLSSLVGIAGLYFWMEVDFIAAVQIVVYVGGIVVLIIFSIFLTQQSGQKMQPTPLMRNIAAIGAAAFGYLLTCTFLSKYEFQLSSQPFDNSVERIGSLMLGTGPGGYALPFEAVSILLLSAMIGCIVIALKSTSEQP